MFKGFDTDLEFTEPGYKPTGVLDEIKRPALVDDEEKLCQGDDDPHRKLSFGVLADILQGFKRH